MRTFCAQECLTKNDCRGARWVCPAALISMLPCNGVAQSVFHKCPQLMHMAKAFLANVLLKFSVRAALTFHASGLHAQCSAPTKDEQELTKTSSAAWFNSIKLTSPPGARGSRLPQSWNYQSGPSTKRESTQLWVTLICLSFSGLYQGLVSRFLEESQYEPPISRLHQLGCI